MSRWWVLALFGVVSCGGTVEAGGDESGNGAAGTGGGDEPGALACQVTCAGIDDLCGGARPGCFDRCLRNARQELELACLRASDEAARCWSAQASRELECIDDGARLVLDAPCTEQGARAACACRGDCD